MHKCLNLKNDENSFSNGNIHKYFRGVLLQPVKGKPDFSHKVYINYKLYIFYNLYNFSHIYLWE
jgi:hypothetical protein